MADPHKPSALQLFEQIVDLPAPQRAERLAMVRSGDASLAAEVEAMLGADALAASPLDRAGAGGPLLASALAAEKPRPAEPLLAGRYEIVRVVGEGGMGVVYEAVQASPRRRVALKALRPGLASRSMLRRFAQEADLLARLQHPGIAQIFEAGIDDPDSPERAFIAMEFVDGKPITEHARDAKLRPGECAALMARVCDAVQHAHQRGVIHRDLKPGNILVDQSGAPKVLDFGVARLAEPGAALTMHTAHGQIVGTLGYMAPEQLDADPGAPDATADIFSLGCILYELLAGRPARDVADKPLDAAAAMVRTSPVPLGSLNRACRGDLETIVARAMHPEPARRYQSADALGDDLRRAVAGRPIAARRDSAWYVARRMARRHWAFSGLAALLLLGVLLFGVVSAVMSRRNSQLAQGLTRSLYVSRIGHAQVALAGGDVHRADGLLRACPPELRGWEWNYFNGLIDRPLREIPLDAEVESAAWSPDGARIAAGTADGRMHLVETASGRVLWTGGADGGHHDVQYSPDARFVASRVQGGGFEVLDAASGATVLRGGPEARSDSANLVRALRFVPGSSILLVVRQAALVDRWDLASGAALAPIALPLRECGSAAVSRDGRLLFAGSTMQSAAIIWSLEQDALVARVDLSPRSVVFTPDDRAVLVGTFEGAVLRWGWSDGLMPVELYRHEFVVHAIDVSPDGLLATGGRDRVLRVWDLARARMVSEQRGQPMVIYTAAFSPEGSEILTAGSDRSVRLWSPSPAHATPSVRLQDESVVALSVDGDDLVACTREGAAYRVDPETGDSALLLKLGSGSCRSVVSLADGRRAATGDDGKVHLFTGEPGAPGLPSATVPLFTRQATQLRRAPDGSFLVAFGPSPTIHVLSPVDASSTTSFTVAAERTVDVEIGDDGLIAIASADGRVRFRDRAGAVAGADLETGLSLSAIKLGRSRRLLVAAASDGAWRAWSLPDHEELSRVPAGGVGIARLALLSADERLVTIGFDRTPRIWLLDHAEELCVLTGHASAPTAVAVRPGRSTLYTADSAGAVLAWRAGLAGN